MRRLPRERRIFLAEEFGDLANLAVAALVFGQALGSNGFSPSVAVAGIVVWAVLTAAGFVLSAGTNR
jgi:hypothetical protein